MQKILVNSMFAALILAVLANPVLADVIDDPIEIAGNEGIIGAIVAGIVVVTLGVYKFYFRKKK